MYFKVSQICFRVIVAWELTTAHACIILMLTKSICNHFGSRSPGPSTLVKQAFGWYTFLISTMLSTMRRTVRTLSDSDNEEIRGAKRIADVSDSDEEMPVPPLLSDSDVPPDLVPISSRRVASLSDSEDLEGLWDSDDCDDLIQECASPSAKPELPLHMVGDGTKFGVELFSGSGNLSKELGCRG